LLDKIEAAVVAGAVRIPRRVLVIVLAVAVVAGAGAFTTEKVVAAADRTMNTTVSTIQVGNMTRSYTVLTPAKTTLSASAPIIVALSGLNAEQSQEITRDEFTSYATAGEAEVVYPLAYRESWNAIGCCSWAAQAKVNDVGFMKDLVQQLDPGHTRPIYLEGYSNGARLAYTMACEDPGLFDGIAAVKGDPMEWCNISTPQKILQIASTDDTDTPWYTGEKGNFRESPSSQVEDNTLRYEDKCSTKSTSSQQGDMTLTTWSDCADGASVSFAVYTAGVHSFPRPPVSYPAASQVIWAWINNTTTVKPQPKLVKS
jgi:polyhydroxybutyrate depolymerase